MLHQTLPGVPEAVTDARAWTRTAVLARYPNADAEIAAEIAAELVAAAVQHTPQDKLIEVVLRERSSGEPVLEVRDPNKSDPHRGGDWGWLSRSVRDFGTHTGPEGHVAWCTLPGARPVARSA
jgi:hypothetical protein